MPEMEAIEQKLAKGTLVNFLGVLAKMLHPAFLWLVYQLYGPVVAGVYVIANDLIEMSISFTLSGVQDGVLMFASRHVDHEDEQDVMYQVMANALVFVLFFTGVFVVASHTVAEPLFARYYSQIGNLAPTVKWMVLALPFIALTQIIVAATKSMMIMKYDALLLGFFKPFLLLVFAGLLYLWRADSVALAWAYFLSNALLALAAVWIFARHFSLARLLAQVKRFRLHKELITFSIPQNLNLTLFYFMSGLGTQFLAFNGYQEKSIAFYALGATIVRNLKQVRLAFMHAFTPVIARFYKEGRNLELSEQYSRVTRWIVTLAAPITLLLIAMRDEVILLFSTSFSGDSHFMIILAVAAFVACAFGLAANIVVMTGHSKWNLYNGLVVAAVSIAFNALLIPRWGIVGAALATLGATLVSVSLKNYQTYAWLKIPLQWGKIWKPFGAFLIAVLVFAAGEGFLPPVWWSALATALASMLVFGLALWRLGLASDDVAMFRGWFSRNKERQG